MESLRILPYTSVNVRVVNGLLLKFNAVNGQSPEISMVNGQNSWSKFWPCSRSCDYRVYGSDTPLFSIQQVTKSWAGTHFCNHKLEYTLSFKNVYSVHGIDINWIRSTETGGQKGHVMWIVTNQQGAWWCNALQLPSEKMLWNPSIVFTYWLQSESYEYSHLSTLSEAIKWSKTHYSKSLSTESSLLENNILWCSGHSVHWKLKEEILSG